MSNALSRLTVRFLTFDKPIIYIPAMKGGQPRACRQVQSPCRNEMAIATLI